MKRQLLVSLSRLLLALALFVVLIAPKNANAMTCTTALWGDQICVQCFVYSPLGWIPIGDPTWTTCAMDP